MMFCGVWCQMRPGAAPRIPWAHPEAGLVPDVGPPWGPGPARLRAPRNLWGPKVCKKYAKSVNSYCWYTFTIICAYCLHTCYIFVAGIWYTFGIFWHTSNMCLHTIGILFVYFRRTCCVLLAYLWHTFGIPLAYFWHTFCYFGIL